jgi:hypothetical protein
MTDRIHSITLTLAHDMRIDDAGALIAAAHQFRGVINVTPNVADVSSHVAQQRALNELRDKLWNVLYPKDSQG